VAWLHTELLLLPVQVEAAKRTLQYINPDVDIEVHCMDITTVDNFESFCACIRCACGRVVGKREPTMWPGSRVRVVAFWVPGRAVWAAGRLLWCWAAWTTLVPALPSIGWASSVLVLPPPPPLLNETECPGGPP
jgi:hypothetical protein